MKSIMWQYIREEKEVVKKQLDSNQTRILADKFAGKFKTVYFVGHGSSYNAAVSVLPFFSGVCGLRSYAYTPENLFCCGRSLLLEDRKSTLVVAISQTGTSSGVLKALQFARENGFTTLGVTAIRQTPIEKLSDYVLELLCGEEDSNAKTKGYTATLTALLLLAFDMGEGDFKQYTDELADMVEDLPEITDRAIAFAEKNNFGKDLKNLYVVAGGTLLGSAQEGQLKVMETMCIPTMFNNIGELSHGMHRSIYDDSSVLFIRDADDGGNQILKAAEYFEEQGSSVWMIDCSGQPNLSEKVSKVLEIPQYKKTHSLLLVVLAIQVLSVACCEQIGIDPNRDSHNEFTAIDETRVKDI